jgi:segregation and condensation protein A
VAETLESKASKAAPMDRLWAENDDSRVTGDPSLVVDVAGFEGPLDLLLHLARTQKVDLARISILALVEQYLTFVETARALRLELAADYLVMAAWLAYLKSRLLLPEQDEEEPSGEDLAQALAFQLQRLEAMQEVGAELLDRPRLGRDVFARGAPEGIQVVSKSIFDLSLYDLLKAYTEHKRKEEYGTWRIQPTELYSMEDALQHLSDLLGRLPDWTALASFVPGAVGNSLLSRSAMAAHFVASLELTKAGKLELRQEGVFSPIYLRRVRSPQP